MNKITITEKKIINIFQKLAADYNIESDELKQKYLPKFFSKKKRKKTKLEDFERTCLIEPGSLSHLIQE